jgi:hypothetical protein
MADPSVALAWVVDLLTSREVPFQAVGGLAARFCGATRPLVDLDFYLSLQRYGDIEATVLPYLTRAPWSYRDDAWELTFAQIVYAGQKVEPGGIEDARYYDRVRGCWRPTCRTESGPAKRSGWKGARSSASATAGSTGSLTTADRPRRPEALPAASPLCRGPTSGGGGRGAEHDFATASGGLYRIVLVIRG